MRFDNVHIAGPAIRIVAGHADLKLGPGPVNFRPSGEDVTVTLEAGKGTSNACKGKFVPFPE
jgi:hypothetical protein